MATDAEPTTPALSMRTVYSVDVDGVAVGLGQVVQLRPVVGSHEYVAPAGPCAVRLTPALLEQRVVALDDSDMRKGTKG